MRVTFQPMKYTMNNNDPTDLALTFPPPHHQFIQLIQIQKFIQWKQHALSQAYTLISDNPFLLIFRKIYPFDGIGHETISRVLVHLFEKFQLVSIFYQAQVYHKVIQQSMVQLQDITLHQAIIRQSAKQYQLRIFSLKNQRQHVQTQINKLQQFRQETLIYSMEDRMGCIDDKDTGVFISTLCANYGKKIVQKIQRRMKKHGMDNFVKICSIQPYPQLNYDHSVSSSQSQLSNIFKNNTDDYPHKSGIVFYLYGFHQAFPLMYNLIDRFIQKIQWIVVQTQRIHCCRKKQLTQYFRNTHNKLAVLLSNNKEDKCERVLCFASKKQQKQIERMLCTNAKLITSLQYPKEKFHSLSQNPKDFYGFIANDKINLRNFIKIYPDYILFTGTAAEERLLRSKMVQFFQQYQQEKAQVTFFRNSFQVSIFVQFYAASFTDQQISFFTLNEKLYRKNRKKDTQTLMMQLRQSYHKIQKNIFWRPLRNPPNNLKQYYRVSPAPQWTNHQCLSSLIFKIQDKLTLYIRSYGSLGSRQGQCVFPINDQEQCQEFSTIMEEEQMAKDFIDKVIKNKMMDIQLRRSRCFKSVIPWAVNRFCNKGRADKRDQARLKQAVQQLLELSKGIRHVKIAFPSDGNQIAHLIVPPILQNCLSACKYLPQARLKQITFFTSMRQGQQLRQALMSAMRKFTTQEHYRIQKISDLLFLQTDLQKIVEYGYFVLKYCDKGATHSASFVNSYVFMVQRNKKNKVPLFLPQNTPKNPFSTEYVVCLFSGEVFTIYRRVVIKLQRSLPQLPQLQQLCGIVKRVFTNVNYLVLYGDQKATSFSQRLFFTSPAQNHHKQLQQVSINRKSGKIAVGGGTMAFELVKSELLEGYKIETHRKKVDELNQIISSLAQ